MTKLIRRLTEQAPCEDCINFELCSEEELACHDFLEFIRHGQVTKQRERIPSRTNFKKAYYDKL